MKNSDIQSRSSVTLDKVFGLLGELRSTASGCIIYRHLEQMLSDMAADQRRAEAAYASFLGMLLEACLAQVPPADPLYTQLSLVQLRLTPPLSVSELGALNRCVEAAADEMLRSEAFHAADLGPALSPLLAHFSGAADAPAPLSGEDGASRQPQAEQRVNAAYRAHLDEKRETMQRLQSDFFAQMEEAVAEYDAFGELLDAALKLMREATNLDELEGQRLQLVASLQDLCAGHRALAVKFSRAQDYLGLIEDDHQQLSDELDRVRLLSLTDELTGLPNRRAFLRRLEDEVSRVQRHDAPLSLVIMDLDFFKRINDQQGHAAGDKVLRCYADRVLSIFRHHDLVARYGGEEFAVLLPNTAQAGVLRALEKVRRRLDEVETLLDEGEPSLPTFSAGVAEYVTGETVHNFIARADAALYTAKRNGRDRVEVDGEPLAAQTPEGA